MMHDVHLQGMKLGIENPADEVVDHHSICTSTLYLLMLSCKRILCLAVLGRRSGRSAMKSGYAGDASRTNW